MEDILIWKLLWAKIDQHIDIKDIIYKIKKITNLHDYKILLKNIKILSIPYKIDKKAN